MHISEHSNIQLSDGSWRIAFSNIIKNILKVSESEVNERFSKTEVMNDQAYGPGLNLNNPPGLNVLSVP